MAQNDNFNLFEGDCSRASLNACVGKNGDFWNFRDYGGGYIRGARALVQECKKPAAFVDSLIYPITACYRHGIELSLKQLIITIQLLDSSVADYHQSHNLIPNWNIGRGAIASLDVIEVAMAELEFVTQVLTSFDSFDDHGMVFRYPEDRQGNHHIGDTVLINVGILSDALDKVADSLGDWDYRIDEFVRENGAMR